MPNVLATIAAELTAIAFDTPLPQAVSSGFVLLPVPYNLSAYIYAVFVFIFPKLAFIFKVVYLKLSMLVEILAEFSEIAVDIALP